VQGLSTGMGLPPSIETENIKNIENSLKIYAQNCSQ
jgi:hypothetical protein